MKGVVTVSEIMTEIGNALIDLGYPGGQIEISSIELNREGYDRLIVDYNGNRIGIYDLQKHTFVD